MRVRRHEPDSPSCECDECWEIRRQAVRRYRRSFAYETGEPVKPKSLSGPAEHGTRRQFNRGCRCVPCVDASNEYRRLMYARTRETRRP